MSKTDSCNISSLGDQYIDPFSKSGKNTLNKSNCSYVSMQENGANMFFLGDSYDKSVMLAKGYFASKIVYDDTEAKWKSKFTKVRQFKTNKIVITDGKGPNKNGLVISPEKGSAISRTLGHITFQI